MEWRVKLDGDTSDLNELSKCVNTPDLAVIKEGDGFFLKSNQFDRLDDYEKVRKETERILDSLNGASRLALGTSNLIMIANIVTLGNDGIQKVFREGSATISTGACISRVVVRADGTTQEVNPADPIPGWMAVARNNESVAKVFRLLHGDTLDWVGLYRIFEIVEDDVGGRSHITQQGWASDGSLTRFKRTANSPSTIGDEARHGKEPTEPPPKPMSFSEAKGLIETVLHNWLRSK